MYVVGQIFTSDVEASMHFHVQLCNYYTCDIITIIILNLSLRVRRLLNLYTRYYKFKSNILVPIFVIVSLCYIN
jgi:hypothetical protein